MTGGVRVGIVRACDRPINEPDDLTLSQEPRTDIGGGVFSCPSSSEGDPATGPAEHQQASLEDGGSTPPSGSDDAPVAQQQSAESNDLGGSGFDSRRAPHRSGGPTEDVGRAQAPPGDAGPNPARSTKLYVVGRRDLAPGLRAAQLAHACIAWAVRHGEPPDNLVLLEAPPDELARALEQYPEAIPFHEPDLDGQLTAFAVACDGRHLSSFRLALRIRRRDE